MVEINTQVKKLVNRVIEFFSALELCVYLKFDFEEVVVVEFSHQEVFILVNAVDDVFIDKVKHFENEEFL